MKKQFSFAPLQNLILCTGEKPKIGNADAFNERRHVVGLVGAGISAEDIKMLVGSRLVGSRSIND